MTAFWEIFGSRKQSQLTTVPNKSVRPWLRTPGEGHGGRKTRHRQEVVQHTALTHILEKISTREIKYAVLMTERGEETILEYSLKRWMHMDSGTIY